MKEKENIVRIAYIYKCYVRLKPEAKELDIKVYPLPVGANFQSQGKKS